MALLHIRRFNSPMSLLLFLWNNIYFVFCTFKVSLFAFNHECTCWSSLFKTTYLLSDVISSKQQNSVVSSAYIKKLNILLELGKSFIYIKNKRGPSIDPCGTPLRIDFMSEIHVSNWTYCFRFSR